MTKKSTPSLSITLVTPTNINRLDETIEALKLQSIRNDIEIIFITRKNTITKKQQEEWEKIFCKIKIVETEKILDVSKTAYKGLPYAEGEVIVFMEDHVYPIKKWAEFLVKAHQSPYSVIGSNYLNANPETGWSWSALFLYYGASVCQTKSKEVKDLPLHNISYKMEVIRPYFEQISTLLVDWENGLHPILRKNGHRFFVESKAKIYHRNPTKGKHLNNVSFAAGRLYGWHRVRREDWSLARRIIYFFGSPLIPFLRMFQFWQLLRHNDTLKHFSLSGWTTLFIQLTFNGIGQAIGFLFGKGNAPKIITNNELIDRKSIS